MMMLMLMLGTTSACWPPDFFTLCLGIQQKGNQINRLCPNTVYRPDLTMNHPLFQRCEFWHDGTTVQCGDYGLNENCVIEGGDMPFIAPSDRGPMHIIFKGITIRNSVNTDASIVIQTGNSATFDNCIWENNVSANSIVVSYGTSMKFKDVIFRNNRSVNGHTGSNILMEAGGNAHFEGHACFQNNVLEGQGLVHVGSMASISLPLSSPDCSMNNTIAGLCDEVYLEANSTCVSFEHTSAHILPSSFPSVAFVPSTYPSYAPVIMLSQLPTNLPIGSPSFSPSILPSVEVSMLPSVGTFQPSFLPTFLPSERLKETDHPTYIPSEASSLHPSFVPSSSPSVSIPSPKFSTPWPSIFHRLSSQPSSMQSEISSQIPTTKGESLPPSTLSLMPSIEPSGTAKPSLVASIPIGCVTTGHHVNSHSRHQHHSILCPPSDMDMPSNMPSDNSVFSGSQNPSFFLEPSILVLTLTPSVQQSLSSSSSIPSNQFGKYFLPSNAPNAHVHHAMPAGDNNLQPHNNEYLVTASPKATPIDITSVSPSSFPPKPNGTDNSEIFLFVFACTAGAASIISFGYIVYKKIDEFSTSNENASAVERKGKIMLDID